MKTQLERGGGKDRKQYYANWYAENADEMNARRRDRYKDDPDYREVAQVRARERKRVLLAERKGRVVRRYKGKKVYVYSITYICREVGVQSHQIRALETEGEIPETVFPGQRVYTEHQAVMLMEYLKQPVNGGDNKLRKKMKAEWLKGLK